MNINDKNFRNYLFNFMANLFSEVSKKIIIPYYSNLTTSQIEIKSEDNDFVTLADKNSEEYYTKILRNEFKFVSVIGEEESYINSFQFKEIDNNYHWAIDPIDGTKNYINSDKNFCSMISLILNRGPIASFIFFPLLETMTFAFKNYGTFNYNLKTKFLKKYFINKSFKYYGTGGTKGIPKVHRSRILEKLKFNTKRLFIGSAGIETQFLVNNKIDFIIHGRVTPWDHSPLYLIIKEAGGIVLMLRDKSEYNVLSSGPILASTSINNWNIIRDLILPLEDEYRIK